MGEYGIDYGITQAGFEIKRMDDILDEIHADLTEGFGVDTQQSDNSFLDVMVITFANQIADLWETAQDSYFSKYPSTAEGINLDNAVQFGGVRRTPAQPTIYPLHCTGDDGTELDAGVTVGTTTMPEQRLYLDKSTEISRDSCNSLDVRVVSVVVGDTYSIVINDVTTISYTAVTNDDEEDILTALKTSINNLNNGFVATVLQPENEEDDILLHISNSSIYVNSSFELTENLTTESVTTIANFITEEYGKIIIPNNIITEIIDNVAGLNAVTNVIEATYGRDEETDIELRQSYIAKSALRSDTMLGSVVSEILDKVNGVQTVSAFENDTDTTANGIAPHSINLIVEGGNDTEIAQAILRRKAGGIGTTGTVHVDVPTTYGDIVGINFSRPTYIYTWVYVCVYGTNLPSNYDELITNAVYTYIAGLNANDNLYIQKLEQMIYDVIENITYVVITTSTETTLSSQAPSTEDYLEGNVIINRTEKIKVNSDMITVAYGGEDLPVEEDESEGE